MNRNSWRLKIRPHFKLSAVNCYSLFTIRYSLLTFLLRAGVLALAAEFFLAGRKQFHGPVQRHLQGPPRRCAPRPALVHEISHAGLPAETDPLDRKDLQAHAQVEQVPGPQSGAARAGQGLDHRGPGETDFGIHRGLPGDAFGERERLAHLAGELAEIAAHYPTVGEALQVGDFVTKLVRRYTPAEMTEDLVLVRHQNDEEYLPLRYGYGAFPLSAVLVPGAGVTWFWWRRRRKPRGGRV